MWDEKFEHLDERFEYLKSVTERVKRLEKERVEDAHSIKSELITPYPAVKRPVPRELEVRDFQSKQDPTGEKIPIKLALEAVPFFDGYRPSVFQFLKACERAKSMLAPQQETQLTKLLMNKLRGHALIAIGDSDLITLDEFGNKLKQYFAPCKNVNQYKDELGYTFKKPGENILDYITRVQNLRLAIIDGEKRNYGEISATLQENINADTLEAFIKGLPREISLRLRQERQGLGLDEIYALAVKIDKEVKLEDERMKTSSYTRQQPVSRDQRANPSVPQNKPNSGPPKYDGAISKWQNNQPRNNAWQPNSSQNSGAATSSPNQLEISCNYCKKSGHLIKDCFKFKAKVESGEIVPYSRMNQGNEQGHPETSGAIRSGNPPQRQKIMKIGVPKTEEAKPSGKSTPWKPTLEIEEKKSVKEQQTKKESMEEEDEQINEQ